MGDAYFEAGAGLGKGLSSSIERIAKKRVEDQAAKEKRRGEMESEALKGGYAEPVFGPGGEISLRPVTAPPVAPEGYAYARKRPGHDLVYSGGLQGQG